jgi:hypothetical protein
MSAFKVTIYGTDTNIDSSIVLKTTLDALSDEVVETFDVMGLYMRQNDDIEIKKNLNGRQLITYKQTYESYTIDLDWQSFIQQTATPTYNANRFNFTLLKKKYHFLFFHNDGDVINDYPYLSYFLNAGNVETYALQVVFLGKSDVEQFSSLNKWSLNFETAYSLE